MKVFRWINCCYGYEKCEAKVSVRAYTNEKLLLLDFRTVTGMVGEVFLTAEAAKQLLKDLQEAIKSIGGDENE